MGHPHHHPSCQGTHALVPKAMETPQTSLSRSNPSVMLGQRRSPLPSCGEIRTVEDLGASNSPYFTTTHEWSGQFQRRNRHLTHRMPRKGLIYYDELDGPDHTRLFLKIDNPSTCGLYFTMFFMVEGAVVNVVDRPILWHTVHSGSYLKTEDLLIHGCERKYQIE